MIGMQYIKFVVFIVLYVFIVFYSRTTSLLYGILGICSLSVCNGYIVASHSGLRENFLHE